MIVFVRLLCFYIKIEWMFLSISHLLNGAFFFLIENTISTETFKYFYKNSMPYEKYFLKCNFKDWVNKSASFTIPAQAQRAGNWGWIALGKRIA